MRLTAVLHFVAGGAAGVDLGHDQRRRAARVLSLEPDAPILVVEIERPPFHVRVAQHDTRLVGVLAAHRQALPVRRSDDGEPAFLAGDFDTGR